MPMYAVGKTCNVCDFMRHFLSPFLCHYFVIMSTGPKMSDLNTNYGSMMSQHA